MRAATLVQDWGGEELQSVWAGAAFFHRRTHEVAENARRPVFGKLLPFQPGGGMLKLEDVEMRRGCNRTDALFNDLQNMLARVASCRGWHLGILSSGAASDLSKVFGLRIRPAKAISELTGQFNDAGVFSG